MQAKKKKKRKKEEGTKEGQVMALIPVVEEDQAFWRTFRWCHSSRLGSYGRGREKKEKRGEKHTWQIG